MNSCSHQAWKRLPCKLVTTKLRCLKTRKTIMCTHMRERERALLLCINTIINFHLIHVGGKLFIYSSHGFWGFSLPLATPFWNGKGALLGDPIDVDFTSNECLLNVGL